MLKQFTVLCCLSIALCSSSILLASRDTTSGERSTPSLSSNNDAVIRLHYFYAYDCSRCKEAHTEIDAIKKQYPELAVSEYEVKRNAGNISLLETFSRTYGFDPKEYPVIFIGREARAGFYKGNTDAVIRAEIERLKGNHLSSSDGGRLSLPLIGGINPGNMSLGSLAMLIGFADGFNPCAFWVLALLLGMLLHTKERGRVLAVGLLFVSASGIVYFAFMAAWLKLFFVAGFSAVVSKIIGTVLICMGIVGIKDFFLFKKLLSFSIPERVKPALYARIRLLVKERGGLAALAGVFILALFVNVIELGCTAGLPAAFTRLLSLRGTGGVSPYLYLALYNFFYVIPLLAIVAVVVLSMKRFSLSERFGRMLKLFSGVLLLVFGVYLIVMR